jgi:hypothetical protein
MAAAFAKLQTASAETCQMLPCRSLPARVRASTCASMACSPPMCAWCRPRPAAPRAWCSCRWTASSSATGWCMPAEVHLLGASIGAWRMAAACLPDADAALAQLAEDYIGQAYPHAPGACPRTAVSASFRAAHRRAPGRTRSAEILSTRATGCMSSPAAGGAGCTGRAARHAGWAGRAFAANAMPAGGRWAAGCSGWCSATRATPCLCPCTTTQRPGADAGQPRPGGAGQLRRSRLRWSRCTTCPAARRAPTGTAASPTTTCTCATRHGRGPGAVPALPAPGGAGLAGQAWRHRHRATPGAGQPGAAGAASRVGGPLPNAKLPDRRLQVVWRDIAGRSATGVARWPKASGWPTSLPNSWRGRAPIDALAVGLRGGLG